MPYLKLNTNITLSPDETATLLTQLSALVADKTNKPERYVMVEIAAAQAMLFAGTTQPLAYLECKSIGLTLSQPKALTAAICQLLHTRLQIAPERIYIEFSDASSAYWGWNGSTFS